jgi:protein-tyrosine-phosphatase
MINYEIRRKLGLPLQENEKYLLGILESFQMELSSPINKEIQRQKLNEFVDIIKSLETRKRHNQKPLSANSSGSVNSNGGGTETFDPSSLSEIQKTLREQQKAFKSLIDMINKDAKDLELIKKSVLNEK